MESPAKTILAAALCLLSFNSVAADIRQVGYFKDGARNRIFSLAFAPNVGKATIRAHAEGLAFTQGQMMAAYYYPDGSKIPADGLTLAKSVLHATDVLYETRGLSRWRYAFMRDFDGAVRFVDCQAEPKNDLCRQ